MEEIIIRDNNSVGFANKELQKATIKIMNLANSIRKNLYNVAWIMKGVDETECYKDDGFKNAAEWAMQTFNFKKSAAYTLIRIGKEYTEEQISEKGKVIGYSSNIAPTSDEDFSTTQIEKMLPLGRERIIELVEAGEIKPSMTVNEIKAIVKRELEESAEDTNEEPVETTEEPVENTEEPSEITETEEEDEIERAFQSAAVALADLQIALKGTPGEIKVKALVKLLENIANEIAEYNE